MKKILIMSCALLIFVGCTTNLDNTPKKKVEEFFNKYQTLDSSVLNDLDGVLGAEVTLDERYKDEYRKIVKNNYQKLSYDIKDETINGDTAVVEVEIEVIDYSKAINESELYLNTNQNEFMNDDNEYDENKYNDYRLNLFKNTNDTVKYTLNLGLTKKDKEWTLDRLSDTDLAKINGTYSY